jgi:glutathione S-transferase
MLRWMFWEQYNHEPNIATLKFWRLFIGEDALTDAQRAQLPAKQAAGEAALRLMDEHLAHGPWFVGAFSLADISLYAYTHAAEIAGFDLGSCPNVRRWLAAVAAQPGHIVMDG